VPAARAAPPGAQDQLRTALAMGADRGIHVLTDANLEPLAVAKLLAALARREQPALCLLGKQAIDGDNNHTGALPRPLRACQRPCTGTLHAEGVPGGPPPGICRRLAACSLASRRRAQAPRRAARRACHCAQARCWRRCWTGRRPRSRPGWSRTRRPAW